MEVRERYGWLMVITHYVYLLKYRELRRLSEWTYIDYLTSDIISIIKCAKPHYTRLMAIERTIYYCSWELIK